MAKYGILFPDPKFSEKQIFVLFWLKPLRYMRPTNFYQPLKLVVNSNYARFTDFGTSCFFLELHFCI